MKALLIGLLPDYDSNFSLALACLKSYAYKNPIIQANVELKIQLFRNSQAFHKEEFFIDINSIVDAVISEKPDLIGFSCYVWNIELAERIARVVKLVLTHVVIVFGGPQATATGLEILSTNPAVDLIVIGEGEQTFSDILEYYLRGKPNLAEIPGIMWRNESQIMNTSVRSNMEFMDIIPRPQLNPLITEFSKNRRRIIWETCRGCVFDCDYCNYTGNGLRRIRSYSIARIKEDLLTFASAGVERITCIDATFNYQPARTCEILDFISRHCRGIKFLFSIKADLLDQDQIGLFNNLATNGMIAEIEIGLQTANPVALKSIHRKWNRQKFTDNITQFNDALRALSRVDLIYGLPDDDFANFLKSITYIREDLRITNIAMYRLSVLPGTSLHRNAHKFGLTYDPSPPYLVYSSNTFPYLDIMRVSNLMEM